MLKQILFWTWSLLIVLLSCSTIWSTVNGQHQQNAVTVGAILSDTINTTSSTISSSSTARPKVKLDVYYETLCPDSIRFLLNQLIANYDQIKNIVNLQLHPFGKAQFFESGNSFEFYCQHGPKECRGNMIHCCVLDQTDYDYSLSFIKCMEKDLYGLRRPNVDAVAQKCANRTNIDWKYIDECASGNRGKQLLVEAGRKTKAIKPKISFVPTIIINEKYSDRIQSQALYGDFVQLIENHYNKRGEDLE